MVRTCKIFFSRTRSYDVELWHPASGTQALHIIIESLDPLRAQRTFVRKKLGHTAVSAITASSVTLLNLAKVYINDDPGLTLTYFTARSNRVAFTFKLGKLLQSHLRRYAANDKIFKLFILHPFLASTIYNNTIKTNLI